MISQPRHPSSTLRRLLGKSLCACSRREPIPLIPRTIPFPNNPNNIHGIISSSVYSIQAPHQPLQTITGKPLDITFNPNATGSVVYTLIPVPHHWKKKVKQNLDPDIALGIIEPVPVGTPKTWCSRMIVAPKKHSSPRHTTDLQKLKTANHEGNRSHLDPI